MENAAESTISSSSMPSSSPPLETIVVVSGANATATTAAQGPADEGSRNGINWAVIMDIINFHMQNRCIQFIIVWMTIIFPRLRRVIANIIQEVSQTVGLAFIAVCIQNINQVAFSQGNTLTQTPLQRVNGIAVILLLYGLLIPNHAGGRFATFIGVILVAGSAVAVAFR